MMNICLHLKLAGALLVLLGLSHSLFGRFFGWKKELDQLSLLLRQMFSVHCFFIALLVVMVGVLSFCYAPELIGSGPLSRIILTGLTAFWSLRLLCQFFVYDPAIWRGRRFYTVMHVLFSILWLYISLVYSIALRVAWVSGRT